MIAAAAAVLAGNLVLALVACQGPQHEMNSVQRAAWDRRQAAARSEWKRAERQLWLTEERTGQLRRRLARIRPELEQAQVREREREQELKRVLAKLAAIEEDSAAAARRRKEIEAELTGVRELERLLSERGTKMAELRTELAALDGQLVVARAGLAARQQSVRALLVKIAADLAALGESEQSLKQAIQVIWDAASAHVPPPAVESEQNEQQEPPKTPPKKDG